MMNVSSNAYINNNAFNEFNLKRENYFLKSEVQNKANDKKVNKLALFASIAGATIPLALYNAKKGKLSLKNDVFSSSIKTKDKFKNLSKYLEVENLKQIGISVLGAISFGLLGGLKTSKNKEDKKIKTQEAIYEIFNCLFPIGIISGVEHILDSKNIKSNIPIKALTVIGGVLSGMFIANKVSNKVNKTIFKDDKDFKERQMKPTDCLVHADDIIGVLVISKVPFAPTLGKFLPFIYSNCGYETANARKCENEN